MRLTTAVNKKILFYCRRIKNAGSRLDQLSRTREALNWGTALKEKLEYTKLTLENSFRAMIGAWRLESNFPVDNVRPIVIPDQARDARKFRFATWASILSESSLGSWALTGISKLSFPLSAIVSVCAAFLITYILHGIFLAVFHDEDAPREVIDLIKRRVTIPAAIVTFTFLAILLLSRTVVGFLALMMAYAFGVSIWGASLGFIFLAAAFSARAHILGWSVPLNKFYNAVGSLIDELNKKLSLWKDAELDLIKKLTSQDERSKLCSSE